MDVNELKNKRLKIHNDKLDRLKEIDKQQRKAQKEAKKNFSRVDQIKLAKASNKITEGSLILEGGAFRGLYTAGVLDCLMDEDINLRKVVGISAGGLTGSNYVSGNRGRSALGILKNRFNSRYVGTRAILESGSVVGFKFMFEDFNDIQVLDEDRLFNSGRQIWVGCTDCNTGEMKYFDNSVDRDTFFLALKASASMPILSKMVEIGDSKYLDGGCNTKVPLDFALENNFEKPIIITTRPIVYRRSDIPKEYRIEEARYRKYPKLLEVLKKSNMKYNSTMEEVARLERDGKLFVIEPSKPVKVSRLESDMEKLGELYELGYRDCKNLLPQIKKYLGIELSESEINSLKPNKNIFKKVFSRIKKIFKK